MPHALRRLLVVAILVVAVGAAFYILTYDPAPRPERPVEVERAAPGEPLRLASWNIANLGGSKDDGEIAVMADVLRPFDLVAIQEVVTSPPGAQAVGRLVDALNRTGAQWDYVISPPTSGRGTERYAYLWKPSRVRLTERPWLEHTLALPLDREPYLARFEDRTTGRRLLLASFHAVPKDKGPAREIALLDDLDRRYDADDLVVLGDFNLPHDEPAFDELRALGFAAALRDQRTTLRMKVGRDGRHLANPYDNIFYEQEALDVRAAGAVDFSGGFPTLKEARAISDHLPVYAEVLWD